MTFPIQTNIFLSYKHTYPPIHITLLFTSLFLLFLVFMKNLIFSKLNIKKITIIFTKEKKNENIITVFFQKNYHHNGLVNYFEEYSYL